MSTGQALAIWTDGGARGNPGPAGVGVRIAQVDSVTGEVLSEVAAISESVGKTTNNQAEYLALLYGLRYLKVYIEQNSKEAKDVRLTCYTDSELLAYQIQGKYKVKNAELRPLYEEAVGWLTQYADWSIIPIRREKNQVADKLVNKAIDAALGRTIGRLI